MLTGSMGYGNTAERLRTDDRQGEEILFLAQEWRKTNHFQQFLRQELTRARTEAEKEVVRAELAVVNRRLVLLKDRLNEVIGPAERSPAAGQEGQTLALQ